MVVVLGGCSGAGGPAEDPTHSPVQTLSAEHMSAVRLVGSWLHAQYPPPPPPPTHVLDLHTESVDADTEHVWGTDSYGEAFDFISNTDGSGSGTWVAFGIEVQGFWGPEVMLDRNTMRQHQVYDFPGMTLDYMATTAFVGGVNRPPFRRVGTQRLDDGRAMQLDFSNDGDGEERTVLTRPEEGVAVEFAVPVMSVPGRTWRPRSNSEVNGSTATRLGPLAFEVQGTEGVWDRWEFAGPGDITGAFDLRPPQLAGSGRVRQSGELVGVLSWTESLVGRLDLTSVATVEVAPSATARDFAIDRWVHDWSKLTPMVIQ